MIWQHYQIIWQIGFLCLVLLGKSNAFAQGKPPLYEDARIRQWAADFIAGRREEVIRSVESDLKSSAPHPFAPHVWTLTQYNLGRLPEATKAVTDPQMQRALGILPEVFTLYRNDQNKKILELYPAAKAKEITDHWTLHYLFHAAIDANRFDEANVFAMRAAELYPESFLIAWNFTNPNLLYEKSRAVAIPWFKSNKQFNGTLFGDFVAHEIENMPTNRAYTKWHFEAINLWTTKYPQDQRALRFKAQVLYGLEKYNESIEVFAAMYAAYPFEPTMPAEYTSALFKLNRSDEAWKKIEQYVPLRYKDPATAEPYVKLEIAKTLQRNGERKKAREILNSLVERWQDNDAAHAELARLELNNDLTVALRHAALAAKLKPANLDYLDLVIQTRQNAEDINGVLEIFRNYEQNSFEKRESIYVRASDTLSRAAASRKDETAKLYAEALKVCEKGLAEFPQSAYIRREYSRVLGLIGRDKEALEQLQKSYEYEDPWTGVIKDHLKFVKKLSGEAQVPAEVEKILARFPWLNDMAQYEKIPAAIIPKPVSSAVPVVTEPRLITQLGHSGAINAVAISSDGKFVLTGGSDGTARLWQNLTAMEFVGRELRQFTAPAGKVNAVAFTPDNRFAIVGDNGGIIRFWDTTTGEQSAVLDTGIPVLALAISPDGKFLAAGGASTTIQVWDVSARKEVFKLKGHTAIIKSLTYSADGRFIVSASSDASAILWNAADGKSIQTFNDSLINSVSLSPDNRYLLTTSGSAANVWDTRIAVIVGSLSNKIPFDLTTAAFAPDGKLAAAAGKHGGLVTFNPKTGAIINRFEPDSKTSNQDGRDYPDDITALAFSSDGKNLVSAGTDKIARSWVVANGKMLQKFVGLSDYALAIAFSPNNERYFVTAGYDRAAHLWDAGEGKEIRRFVGHNDWINSVAISPDGRTVATASSDRTARLWNAETGKQIGDVLPHPAAAVFVAFSPDNRFLLTATSSQDAAVYLREIKTGKLIRSFRGIIDGFSATAFSPDGKYLVTPYVDGIPRIWETETGAEVAMLSGHSAEIWTVAFSPDGKRIATGGLDRTVHLFEAPTGKPIGKPLTGFTGTVVSLAFSGDGKQLIIGSQGSPVILFDSVSQTLIRQFEAESINSDIVRFSPDSRLVVTGNADGLTRLWNAASGKKIAQYARSAGGSAFAFAATKPFLLVGGTDGTVQIAETSSGKVVARLVSFEDAARERTEANWAVIDDKGRYDAAFSGDVEGLHWVIGAEPIQLKQLKDRFFDPQLLSKVMGYSEQSVLQVEKLKDVKLYPEVKVIAPPPNSNQLTINLKNQGGGIGKVVVWINNSEFTADAAQKAKAVFKPTDAQATINLDLTGSNFKPGQKNEIRVEASSFTDQFLKSRGIEIEWEAPGKAETAPPDIYAIVGGINAYNGQDLRLRFAARDAISIAKALQIGANSFLEGTGGKFHLSVLSDLRDPELSTVAPTKPNFEREFKRFAAQAKSKDIFIVYLSGHGVALESGNTYLYLTQEATLANRERLATDVPLRGATTISDQELTDWTLKIAAEKKVMILDTCAAGTVAKKLVEQKDIPTQQRLAIERTQTRTGMYVLMGSTADAPSYEASRYDQGLLTYSLLFGMRGDKEALRNEEFIDVNRLFHYAEDNVPILAQGIGGIQQPIVVAPKESNSFDIGRIPRQMRERIPLALTKHIILRPNFQDSTSFADDLDLIVNVRSLLREREASENDGRLSFKYLDEADFPCAIVPSGGYTITGDDVKVTLKLRRDKKELSTAIIEGKRDKIATLILDKLLAEAGKLSATCAVNPSSTQFAGN